MPDEALDGPHREPAWLTAKVDQKIQLVKEPMLAAARANNAGIVMTFLDEGRAEMTDEERERWERTCDRCQTYVPDEGEFWTGHVVREVEGQQVMMAFGLCGPCRRQP